MITKGEAKLIYENLRVEETNQILNGTLPP